MAHRRRIILSPERQQQIVAAVRAGSYPHIAAQAFGVPSRTFDEWLRRGQAGHGREPFRSFALAVEEAHAQARLRAEMEVLKETPRIWLEHGPGRERPDHLGWSSAVQPSLVRATSHNALLQAEVIELIRVLQEELGAQPEVRQRLGNLIRETRSHAA